MKTTRKIIITLIAPLLLLVMAVPITLAQNGIEGLKSLFTPQRPGIQFIPRETDGFSYPSFNNFIGNTKIENTRLSPGDPSPIPGDERVFLVGHTCPDGDCLQRPVLFGNTPDPVTDGDTVRFSIYFHNNGEDPFDDDGETSPNAEDVQIGIDLTNMPVDPEHPDMLRPKGFISASNQEYRWNPDSNARIGNVIIDAAGNTMTRANQQPLRVATDDLQLLLGEEGLQFDVIENSIQLAMDTSSDGVNNDVVFQIDEPMQIEIPTPDPNDGDEVVTINATPRQDDQRIWLEFDELPGCFSYSGFVYFDVRVFKEEEPPEAVCTGITYDAPFSDRGAVTVDGRSYRPIKIDEINFSDGVVPANAKLKFTSADPDGDFRTFNGSQGPGPLELPANAVSVLYAGNGPVTVEVINVEESEENICKVEIENNACEDISFNFALHRQIGPIQQGNDGRFAQWLQVDSVEFENGAIPANARLHWTSDNPDGEFYFTLLGLGPIGDPLPDIDNDPNTITVETPANNNAGRTLFYFGGEDSIEIKISPEDIQAKCVEEVSFNNPQICTELIVNHNDPIIEGYVSEFSAVAVDENGDTYTEGDGIRYSVDEGFGQFFNEEPETPPASPAPFINNLELRTNQVRFSENRSAWISEVVNNTGAFDGSFDAASARAQMNVDFSLAEDEINPTIELTEEQRENLDKTPKFNFGATNTFN
ncbi:MAG: hypothetical protein KBD17_02505, partial [Candidatus Pacebacteria bacterium]|nr:hypothetical protein [Candidatus Paceibacterota bacterium]